MSQRKPIIVWTSRQPEKQKERAQQLDLDAQQDTAATIELARNDIYLPEPPPKSVTGFKTLFNRWQNGYKLVILATISAVFLGLIFGAVMLKLFAAVEDEAGKTSTTNSQPVQSGAGLLTGFVLQGGMFNQDENARTWQQKFEKQGVPAMLWKQNGHIYLFAGAAATEKEAEQLAEGIREKGLDIYVKAWSVPEQTVRMPEEKEWLRELRQLWKESISRSAGGQALSAGKWDQLLNRIPEGSATLQSKKTKLQKQAASLKGKTGAEAQKRLLEIWHEFQ